MKDETARYLRKAEEFLGKADGMLDTWPDDSARAAYLAAFHAAQALSLSKRTRPLKRITVSISNLRD
jgi:uncharacterized protein (UPF0332 family)